MCKLLLLLPFLNATALWSLGSISGVVTCDDKPKAATVTLENQTTKQTRMATARPNGAFVLRGVRAGDYVLSAEADGCVGEPSDVFHLKAGESKVVDIELRVRHRHHVKKAARPSPDREAPSPPPPPPPPTVTPKSLPALPPPAGNFTTMRIFYATDRQRGDVSQPALFYGAGRYEAQGNGDAYELGQCDVSIPNDHEEGEMESPVWWKLEFRPDPEKHIVLLSVIPEDSATYFNALRQRVASSPAKDAFVFVHGYNTTFEDAARRTAQMAYDLKFKGAPILYSWPSQGDLAKYTYDENNVEWSWRHLYDFLQALSEGSGATTVHLIAHSMGNRALTNALQKMPRMTIPRFREVILAAPDIDAGLFKQMAADMQGKAGRITLYASSKDDALKASKTAHGEPRAGDSDQIVIVNGVDSIDASAAATDFLGHGYVFKDSILYDINNLFRKGKPPQERDKLKQEHLGSFLYWLLTP